MSKLKGLLSTNKGTQQATLIIQPFHKKYQQYQKSMKKFHMIFQKILIEPFTNFYENLHNLNKNFMDEIKYHHHKPSFYMAIIQSFVKVEASYQNANSQMQQHFTQIFQAIGYQCSKIQKSIQILTQKLNLHENKQHQLIDKNNKYCKNHKNLVQAIQSYKTSFQQVNLIYNVKQKIKRYKACQQAYTNILVDLQQIYERIQIISQTRQSINTSLEQLKQLINNFIYKSVNEMIKLPLNLIKCYIHLNKDIQIKIREQLKILNQKNIEIFVQWQRQNSLFVKSNQYYQANKQKQSLYYPEWIGNIKNFKDQHFAKCKGLILQYFNCMLKDIQQRQQVIEKLKNYLNSLNLLFQKAFYSQYKQAKQLCVQKNLKQIKSILQYENLKDEQTQISVKSSLSNQNPSNLSNLVKVKSGLQTTLVKVLSLLDEQKELSKNLHKLTSHQIKQIINQLDQQSKLIVIFRRQFKNIMYKMFSSNQKSLQTYKKEFKADLQKIQHQSNLQNIQLTQQQINHIKSDMIKRVEFLILLIQGFVIKFNKVYSNIKNRTVQFIEEYKKSVLYFQQIYQKYLYEVKENIYQSAHQKDQISTKYVSWIDQNKLFVVIVKDKLKIKFQSQEEKVNQFKKLKKPQNKEQNKQQQIYSSKQQNQNLLENSINFSELDSASVFGSKKGNQNLQSASQKKQSVFKPIPFFNKNYQEYVKRKVKFEEDEKFIDQFTCGLADNIIISGRLYITTHRLFFHSHFNSSNIFFGSTKLEIPKKDIKKILKKYNAVIFDNSISITTVNGEIFFTSFMSRDKAFETISKTFDINHDQNIFVEEQHTEQIIQTKLEDFNINIEQDDDFPDSQMEKRQNQIQQMIDQDQKRHMEVQYRAIHNFQISFPGLNAAKFFKIFQSGQQFFIKNKHYDSFLHYFKGEVNKNQQMDINPWQPNILDYLNPCNIKLHTPYKFTRTFKANVPLPNSNIPFMPKFVQSKQIVDLYFISKNKYIMIVTVNNSKAPTTDCFYLRGKKIVEKTDEGKVKVSEFMKIVFIKKTMMKNLIESKTFQQAEQNQKILQNQLKKYFKHLQNTLMKKNNKNQIKNQLSKENDQIDDENNQNILDKMKINEQKMKTETESLKNQIKIGKIILLISILLNLILISIII